MLKADIFSEAAPDNGGEMTRKELARLAFEECCSEKTTTRYGVKRGNPFWNVESSMFMYVPAFHFPSVRCVNRYRYDAKDERGKIHSFEAEDSCALLTPVWRDLPEGVVQLTVTALSPDGREIALVGARTFFKLASFPECTPPAVCSYRECAEKAYRFAMQESFVQHWLKYAKPDPSYDLNTYPSKMISALVSAMLSYARISPKDKEDALTVARNAADYLISITPRGDHPLAGIPPTYSLDFCPDPEKYGVITPNWRAAEAHLGTNMMIYPARSGKMYLDMEAATGEKKYLDEAVRIGMHYLNTVLENGSWYLVRSEKTGEPVSPNYISPLDSVIPFMTALYKRTNDERFKALADRACEYAVNTQLATYNWEGQFEDSPLSTNYVNLTHFGATKLAIHFAENYAHDPDKIELAKELMRFCEDQFVIWNRPYPWPHASNDGGEPYDTSVWHTPCALEQYGWYVPIDDSAASISLGFLSLYKAGCGEIYLAKARALMDQITVMQRENGQIPTHWMNTENAEKNFWFNCMFFSCSVLEEMSRYDDVVIQ